MAGREIVHPADMQMVESSLILFVDNSTWNQNGMAQSTRLDPKLAWYGTRVLDAFPLGNFTKICGPHLPVKVRLRCNNQCTGLVLANKNNKHVCVEH